jgi:hypothetical protein
MDRIQKARSSYIPISSRFISISSRFVPVSSRSVPFSSRFFPISSRFVPISSRFVLVSSGYYNRPRTRYMTSRTFHKQINTGCPASLWTHLLACDGHVLPCDNSFPGSSLAAAAACYCGGFHVKWITLYKISSHQPKIIWIYHKDIFNLIKFAVCGVRLIWQHIANKRLILGTYWKCEV